MMRDLTGTRQMNNQIEQVGKGGLPPLALPNCKLGGPDRGSRRG
jgi:hypothetical protein